MHYSLVKAASVAFLGLGDGLLRPHRALAWPVSRDLSHEVVEKGLPVVETPSSSYDTDLVVSARDDRWNVDVNPFIDKEELDKDKDATSNGYQYYIKRSRYDSEIGTDFYDIWNPKAMRGVYKVNEFGVDVRDGILYVAEAWNDEDISAKKLKMRQLVMAFWVHVVKQEPLALKSVAFLDVTQDDVIKRIKEAYEEMGINGGQTGILSVDIEGKRDGEEDAFDILSKNNPFAVGMAKMTDEYMDHKKDVGTYVILCKTRHPEWSGHFMVMFEDV